MEQCIFFLLHCVLLLFTIHSVFYLLSLMDLSFSLEVVWYGNDLVHKKKFNHNRIDDMLI